MFSSRVIWCGVGYLLWSPHSTLSTNIIIHSTSDTHTLTHIHPHAQKSLRARTYINTHMRTILDDDIHITSHCTTPHSDTIPHETISRHTRTPCTYLTPNLMYLPAGVLFWKSPEHYGERKEVKNSSRENVRGMIASLLQLGLSFISWFTHHITRHVMIWHHMIWYDITSHDSIAWDEKIPYPYRILSHSLPFHSFFFSSLPFFFDSLLFFSFLFSSLLFFSFLFSSTPSLSILSSDITS